MSHRFTLALAFAMGTLAVTGCNRAGATRVGEVGDAAEKVYVAPGKYDEFYAFISGGFNGQVGVYGLPSGRLLKARPGVLAESRERVGLQRGDQADAGDELRLRPLGRRPPSPSSRRPTASPTAAGSSSTATTRRASPAST